MPKKAKTTAKFDPRKSPDKKDEVAPTEVETKPEIAVPAVSPDVLAVISKLTDQVSQLTKQVDTLSSGHKQIEENVDSYRKESVDQREKSIRQVEKNIKSKKQIMKELWEKQETVKMFVPFEGKEKKGARLHVQANGLTYTHADGVMGIPKGVYTSVPMGVFKIASESLNQQIENMGFDSRVDQRETTSEGGKFDPEKLNR